MKMPENVNKIDALTPIFRNSVSALMIINMHSPWKGTWIWQNKHALYQILGQNLIVINHTEEVYALHM